METPDTPEPDRLPSKPRRVLACQLCQQRKVKCNRKFPCANCVRSGAQCVPAALLPRQRRRRFPERELLDRIRHYETLLQQHKIHFEPLHPPAAATEESTSPASVDSPDTPHTAQSDTSGNQARNRPAKSRSTNLWHALSQKAKNLEPEPEDDSDDDRGHDEGDGSFLRDDDGMQDVIRNAWDRTYRHASESNPHLLFGSPVSTITLTTLHPDQAKIFRLWQIYLDNVNPLLKVTHTPSLQARIVDAISDLAHITAPLEALLFSIYCAAILSLAEDQCRTLFGTPKKDLLSGYQFACRQALLNCNILRSDDHDSLTALYLYLVSVRPNTDPRSLSSMLAVAIHIAQHMGYHSESKNAKCSVFEAEMRRRLWWSLVVFNNRVCETFNYRTAVLSPTWDCKLPGNVNDFELLPDSRTTPPVYDKPTEALFVLVRSQISDLIRHCAFHLNFIDPHLTALVPAKNAARGMVPWGHRELCGMQKTLEEKTLAPYDPENPLHFMTMWTAQGYLAKSLLLEHCSRQADAQQHQRQQQQQEQQQAISYALTMLECDTKLMKSPLTKGFRWHIHCHFPFLAYAYIVQHLKRQRQRRADDGSDDELAARAWDVMSDNYDARTMDFSDFSHPLFALYARVVLQAWEAVARQDGDGGDADGDGAPREPPRIVVSIQSKIAQMKSAGLEMAESAGRSVGGADAVDSDGRLRSDDASVFNALPGDIVGGECFGDMFSCGYPDILPGGSAMDVHMDMDQFWPTMDWGPM